MEISLKPKVAHKNSTFVSSSNLTTTNPPPFIVNTEFYESTTPIPESREQHTSNYVKESSIIHAPSYETGVRSQKKPSKTTEETRLGITTKKHTHLRRKNRPMKKVQKNQPTLLDLILMEIQNSDSQESESSSEEEPSMDEMEFPMYDQYNGGREWEYRRPYHAPDTSYMGMMDNNAVRKTENSLYTPFFFRILNTVIDWLRPIFTSSRTSVNRDGTRVFGLSKKMMKIYSGSEEKFGESLSYLLFNLPRYLFVRTLLNWIV